MKNRRIVLAARPQGVLAPGDLRLEEVEAPEPADGQVLLRTLYLSLDPYMRQLMNEEAPVYASSIPLGEPIIGSTVNRVVASRDRRFSEGDLVQANVGWQDLGVADGDDLIPLGEMAQPSRALGVLGLPAYTAYIGMEEISQPKPGETVVVAAAAGAVGGVVGQIAKLRGARAVGIAGGPEKCRHAVEELGFDVCLDRYEPQLAERLATACPDGVDVYFENVGGEVFDAVLPLLNVHARVPLCGFIAHYNDEDAPSGPDRLPEAMSAFQQKRIRVEGLIILDYYAPEKADRFEAFRRDMGAWVQEGSIKLREHVTEGLENAPAALIGLLEGRNVGKAVVHVADD